MSKANDAERISKWNAASVAYYLDRGWIAQWPWEITKKGRRELSRRKMEALVESRVRARLKRRGPR